MGTTSVCEWPPGLYYGFDELYALCLKYSTPSMGYGNVSSQALPKKKNCHQTQKEEYDTSSW